MENQANSKSIIINYGLMLGVANILLSLTMYALGMHYDPHWAISVISIALLIGVIVYGIKTFKTTNNGFISWGQAVKVGVGIAALAGLIGAVYQYIFISFIEPDFMANMMEIQNQKFLDSGMTEEQIEAANEMGKKFSSPLMTAAFSVIGSSIIGFIISAIAGAIMKKTEENDY